VTTKPRAFGKREFTLSPDPYGSGGLIRGRYDAAGYAVLTAALDDLSAPPTLARMLACDAGIIPAILNAHGQPVDVGREHRVYTAAPRTAIEIRDGGCTWPGCRAARHTEADSQRASQRGTSKEHPGSTTPTDHPTPNRLATRRRQPPGP